MSRKGLYVLGHSGGLRFRRLAQRGVCAATSRIIRARRNWRPPAEAENIQCFSTLMFSLHLIFISYFCFFLDVLMHLSVFIAVFKSYGNNIWGNWHSYRRFFAPSSEMFWPFEITNQLHNEIIVCFRGFSYFTFVSFSTVWNFTYWQWDFGFRSQQIVHLSKPWSCEHSVFCLKLWVKLTVMSYSFILSVVTRLCYCHKTSNSIAYITRTSVTTSPEKCDQFPNDRLHL